MQARLGHVRPHATVRVWDRFVRSFHWLLVASFAVAWAFTGSIGIVHKAAGYTALALVAARVLWGFIGTRHARFADFVPSPAHLRRYLSALSRGEEPRYAGHNPLGALMIVFLLLAVATIGVSGWMLTLDAFWGDERVEAVHTIVVDATLLAVCLHVVAGIAASLRHGENLVLSMITGRKPLATSSRPGDDIGERPED